MESTLRMYLNLSEEDRQLYLEFQWALVSRVSKMPSGTVEERIIRHNAFHAGNKEIEREFRRKAFG